MSHGHSHDCAAEHDEISGVDHGWQDSLLPYIHTDNVQCLNESEIGSGKLVFKPWDQRLDKTRFVESDADEQLLFHIPFTNMVKLKSICVSGGPEDAAPSRLKVWINRDDIDFAKADDLKPLQEWELAPDPECMIQYPTKLFNFQNVSSLTMYFCDNFGADTSTIYYIGLTGEWLPHKREAVVATYEARALPSDHKTKSETFGTHHVQ